MARYKITFKKSVAKDFRSIPARDVKRLLKRIDKLADDPRNDGCVKLSGRDFYRVRLGSHRIIYEIRDAVLVVVVIKVAHRSRAYK